MTQKDFTSVILGLREVLTWPLLIIAFVCLGLGIYQLVIASWWWILSVVLSVVFALSAVALNGLYVIMPGHSGYKITMGKLADKSYDAGWGCMIPFISTMTSVDITRQTHTYTNTLKNKFRRDVKLTYVITWSLVPDRVHVLHRTLGEDNYIEKAICPQLDACFTQVVSMLSYENINGNVSKLTKHVMALYTGVDLDPEDRFPEKPIDDDDSTADDGTATADCSSDKDNNYVDYSSWHVGDPMYDSNLFRNIAINITNVSFDKDYEDAIAESAKVEQQRKIVEEEAKQLAISTEAKAKSDIRMAEAEAQVIKLKANAEAEALKMKGASENEVRERLGEILKEKPELIQETLAKNFPKVFGGATPMINLNDFISSSATPAPTSTTV